MDRKKSVREAFEKYLADSGVSEKDVESITATGSGHKSVDFADHISTMVKGAHAFVRLFLFRAGLCYPERLGPTERSAYLTPHPNWSSRTGILVFPREIPSGPQGPVSEFLSEVHSGFAQLRSKPTFITWAMRDIAFLPSYLDELWLPDFPQAEVLRLPDAGHYLQEDAHEKIIPALSDFLLRTRGRPNNPVEADD